MRLNRVESIRFWAGQWTGRGTLHLPAFHSGGRGTPLTFSLVSLIRPPRVEGGCERLVSLGAEVQTAPYKANTKHQDQPGGTCTSGGEAQETITGSWFQQQQGPREGAAPSLLLRRLRRDWVWGALGLLSQQLVEGFGGLPVFVLAAGAVLLHDPVVLAAEPARLGAGGEVAGWVGFFHLTSVPPPALWAQ